MSEPSAKYTETFANYAYPSLPTYPALPKYISGDAIHPPSPTSTRAADSPAALTVDGWSDA